jgi:hypothetical protein
MHSYDEVDSNWRTLLAYALTLFNAAIWIHVLVSAAGLAR